MEGLGDARAMSRKSAKVSRRQVAEQHSSAWHRLLVERNGCSRSATGGFPRRARRLEANAGLVRLGAAAACRSRRPGASCPSHRKKRCAHSSLPSSVFQFCVSRSAAAAACRRKRPGASCPSHGKKRCAHSSLPSFVFQSFVSPDHPAHFASGLSDVRGLEERGDDHHAAGAGGEDGGQIGGLMPPMQKTGRRRPTVASTAATSARPMAGRPGLVGVANKGPKPM